GRRPGRFLNRAFFRLLNRGPKSVGGQSLTEQGRWQRFDARGERTADALGGGTGITDHAHEQAATPEDALVTGQGAHGLVVDQVLVGRDGDRGPAFGIASWLL